jgi:O-antigen ligase
MDLALVAVIDLIAIIGLVILAQGKQGLERALPFAAFLIVLVPIESLIPLGFFTLTTHRIVVGTLVLLYFLRGRSANQGKIAMPLKTIIIVHVFWCLISTANSIVPEMSIKKLLSVVLEYYTLYFIYWKTISNGETIHKILKAMVVGIAVCCVWGTIEAYQGGDILDFFPSVGHHWGATAEQDREIRIHSTYDHPILYGAALAMGITLVLYLLAIAKSQSERMFLWIALLLMFLNIYKTSSRGPWLDTILGCSLLLWFGSKRTRKHILYVVGLSMAVLIIRPGVWSTIGGIYDNTFSNNSTGSSYSYRYALQDAAVQRLREDSITRAIWGYGPEAFFDIHLEGMLLGKPHTFLSCDNAWVEFLLETGYIGLVIVLTLLFKPMWVAWKQYRRLQRPAKYLSLLLFVNFAMMYAQMYSVGLYSWGQNGYTLWILIAMTAAYSTCAKSLPGTHGVSLETTTSKYCTLSNESGCWVRPE